VAAGRELETPCLWKSYSQSLGHYIKSQTMDKVQRKKITSVSHIPKSEPCRVELSFIDCIPLCCRNEVSYVNRNVSFVHLTTIIYLSPPPLALSTSWSSRLHDHSNTPQLVGLLWSVISPTQRPLSDNTQHSQETGIHAPGRIRTRNAIKQAVADQRITLSGHWGSATTYYYK
jgi:hypothetical protein